MSRLKTQPILGDYLIIKEIGGWSLGTLFLAEHRFLKRPVVLKVLSEELSSDSSFIHRFEEEVAAVAALDHPHIVKVHNVSFSDGQYYLVTDFIMDEKLMNLKDYLKCHEGAFKEEKILHLARQIAGALDYAHQKGLVHRGIKLDNILIKEKEDGCDAFLSDFGLTKVLGMRATLSRLYMDLANDLTHDEKSSSLESLLEEISFLAPEQKMGSEGEVAADSYAFGVLLYTLFFREFPDVMIDLSSLRQTEYTIAWDLVLHRLLQKDPVKRPTLLEELFKEDGKARPLLKPQEIARPEYDPDPSAVFHVDNAIVRYQPKEQEAKEIKPLLTEMVIIEGKQYERGSMNGARDEMPRHSITLSDFAIDIHPVTNEQFVRFLEMLGGEKDVNNSDVIRLKDSRIKRTAGKLLIESGYTKHPVVGVTWYGAIAYAKWVGKRLPSEAEWEIAAYGNHSDWIYPTGRNIERSQANFFSSDTTPVMSYPPNGFGLYDMAGNVYDWCQDWYGYHYYQISVQEPINPLGPPQGVYRVLRGGCWKSLKEDLRCAHRHRNNPGTANGTYGFRCAADTVPGTL